MGRKDEVQPADKVTRRKFIRTTLIAGAVISVPWLYANDDSRAQGSPADDALVAFDAAVKAFNDKQSDTLRTPLDPAVELRKVHTNHAKPVINGRDNVIGYLKGAWNGTPPVTMVFDPRFGGSQPDVKIQGPNDSIAVVTGLACWKDDDGDNSDGQLKYKFQLKNTTGAWLVTFLYGTYTGNPLRLAPDDHPTSETYRILTAHSRIRRDVPFLPILLTARSAHLLLFSTGSLKPSVGFRSSPRIHT